MKTEAYLIEGKVYLPLHLSSKVITIEFYLPLIHIEALRKKSNLLLNISKEVKKQPTNDGYKDCKKITITSNPCFIQMFFNKVGFDFKQKVENRILWMPNLIGQFNKKVKYKKLASTHFYTYIKDNKVIKSACNPTFKTDKIVKTPKGGYIQPIY